MSTKGWELPDGSPYTYFVFSYNFFIRRATEDAVFAPGKAIESSLKNLAERRTDIFGVGEDAATEAEIGKKLGDDTEDEIASAREATAWDGHTVSAEGAVRAARDGMIIVKFV